MSHLENLENDLKMQEKNDIQIETHKIDQLIEKYPQAVLVDKIHSRFNFIVTSAPEDKQETLQFFKKTFFSPKIEHAVGIWRNEMDSVLACNQNSIFFIDCAKNCLFLREEKNTILPQKYALWQRYLPQLDRNTIIANFYYQFCKTDNEKFYLVSQDPTKFFNPISFFFDFKVLCATFIHHSTKIVLLLENEIIITKCTDWFEQRDLSVAAIHIEKNENYDCLISSGQRFIAFSSKEIVCYNFKGLQLWKKKLHKIRVVWFLESDFTTAILLCDGNIILLDSETGETLFQQTYNSLAIDSECETFVFKKNSHVDETNSINFFLLSQFNTESDSLQLTTIEEISFYKKENDFSQRQQFKTIENCNKKLCLSENKKIIKNNVIHAAAAASSS